MSEVEEILTSGDDELQELSMDDKKKAINLQDLIYVKGYINSKHNNHKNEMDAKYAEFVDEVTENNDNFKSEMIAGYNAFKTESVAGIDGKIASEINKNLAEVNGAIDDIENGTTTAGNATKIQGVDLADDSVSQIGDYIISKAKLIWSGDIELKRDPNYNALYINTQQAPVDFLGSLQLNRRYKLIMQQNHNTYGTSYTFEGEFATYASFGDSGSMEFHADKVIALPVSATQAGDLALFVVSGHMSKLLSGEYSPTTAIFQLSLITNQSDKLNDTVMSDYTFKIIKMYEIVE